RLAPLAPCPPPGRAVRMPPGNDRSAPGQAPTVLLDSTHRRWLLVTLLLSAAAVAAWLVLDRRAPGGLTGGSTVGLWYGIIGTLLMVYAGLLAAHRKFPRWWRLLGRRAAWLKGHIWLGLLSAVFLLCHAAFRWGGPLTVGLWAVYAGVM